MASCREQKKTVKQDALKYSMVVPLADDNSNDFMSCDGIFCPTGLLKRQNSYLGFTPSMSNCCVIPATCESLFETGTTCNELSNTHTVQSNKSTIEPLGNTDARNEQKRKTHFVDSCCQKPVCKTHTCPAGLQKKGGNIDEKECTGGECTNDQCCEDIPLCSSHTCGPNKHIRDADAKCTEGGCTDSTCCEDNPRCDQHTCESGTMRNNNTNQLCEGETCTTAECCQAIPLCSSHTCSDPNKHIRDADAECTGGVCTDVTCCENNPRCDQHTCESGTKNNNTNKICEGETCTTAECCRTIKTCSSHTCGPNKHIRDADAECTPSNDRKWTMTRGYCRNKTTKKVVSNCHSKSTTAGHEHWMEWVPPTYACNDKSITTQSECTGKYGGGCTDSTCCEDNPRCDQYTCESGTTHNNTNQLCEGETCTTAECCSQNKMCGADDCKDFRGMQALRSNRVRYKLQKKDNYETLSCAGGSREFGGDDTSNVCKPVECCKNPARFYTSTVDCGLDKVRDQCKYMYFYDCKNQDEDTVCSESSPCLCYGKGYIHSSPQTVEIGMTCDDDNLKDLYRTLPFIYDGRTKVQPYEGTRKYHLDGACVAVLGRRKFIEKMKSIQPTFSSKQEIINVYNGRRDKDMYDKTKYENSDRAQFCKISNASFPEEDKTMCSASFGQMYDGEGICGSIPCAAGSKKMCGSDCTSDTCCQCPLGQHPVKSRPPGERPCFSTTGDFSHCPPDIMTCHTNKCTCPNGTGASGTDCPKHGETKCVSCKDGFSGPNCTVCADGYSYKWVFEKQKYECVWDPCICPHGTVDTKKCPESATITSNTLACTRNCDINYKFNSSTGACTSCRSSTTRVIKTEEIPMDDWAQDAECKTACEAADKPSKYKLPCRHVTDKTGDEVYDAAYYQLKSKPTGTFCTVEYPVCEPNTCTCPNGTAAEGGYRGGYKCNEAGLEICIACNEGWTLVDGKCMDSNSSDSIQQEHLQHIEDAKAYISSSEGENRLKNDIMRSAEKEIREREHYVSNGIGDLSRVSCLVNNGTLCFRNLISTGDDVVNGVSDVCSKKLCSVWMRDDPKITELGGRMQSLVCGISAPSFMCGGGGFSCAEGYKKDSNGACTECNTGYFKDGDKCIPNVCTCDLGVGATGVMCPEHGKAWCKKCDEGYALVDGQCRVLTDVEDKKKKEIQAHIDDAKQFVYSEEGRSRFNDPNSNDGWAYKSAKDEIREREHYLNENNISRVSCLVDTINGTTCNRNMTNAQCNEHTYRISSSEKLCSQLMRDDPTIQNPIGYSTKNMVCGVTESMPPWLC